MPEIILLSGLTGLFLIVFGRWDNALYQETKIATVVVPAGYVSSLAFAVSGLALLVVCMRAHRRLLSKTFLEACLGREHFRGPVPKPKEFIRALYTHDGNGIVSAIQAADTRSGVRETDLKPAVKIGVNRVQTLRARARGRFLMIGLFAATFLLFYLTATTGPIFLPQLVGIAAFAAILVVEFWLVRDWCRFYDHALRSSGIR